MKRSLQLLIDRPWLGFAVSAMAIIVQCLPALEHAAFDLDDYRYLLALRELAGAPASRWLSAMVVENRWDDLWWIPEGTFVRFFRAPVILSYALDVWIWGQRAFGFVLTNVLLHIAATGLFCAFLLRLFGARWCVFASTLAFALQASHWENIAYIAGRTDTLAALPLLGALLIHVDCRAQPSRKTQLSIAGLSFLALLSKEYTVLLPLLLVLLDWLATADSAHRLRDAIRRNVTMLAASAALFALYLGVRRLAFGPEGAGTLPYPYFFLPGRPGFLLHTAAALQQYAHGLAAGELVLPFLSDASQLLGGAEERLVSCVWVTGLLLWGFWQREGRWFASVFVLAFAPLLILYTSGRYLYLPSIGYCTLLGLALERMAARLEGKLAALLLARLMIVLPAARLGERFAQLGRNVQFGVERPALRALLDAQVGVAAQQHSTFLLDFPGTWFEMQFAAPTVAMSRGGPLPAFHFLTARTPAASNVAPLHARILDDRTLELSRAGQPLIPHDPQIDLDPAWLPRGAVVRRPGFSVEVTDAAQGTPVRARVRFDQAAFARGLGAQGRPELFAFPGAQLGE